MITHEMRCCQGLPIDCDAQLLLLLLSRCMAGLVHDLGAMAESDGDSIWEARRRRRSGTSGDSGHAAQPSAWALPVAAAVQALAASAGSRKQWTPQAAAGAVDGADLLISYVCPPLWPADEIDAGILQVSSSFFLEDLHAIHKNHRSRCCSHQVP